MSKTDKTMLSTFHFLVFRFNESFTSCSPYEKTPNCVDYLTVWSMYQHFSPLSSEK